MAIRSLQQRIGLMLLFPVALLLIVTGCLGFIYSREILLNEWKEAAILKLERAAHYIDMRLSRSINLIENLNKVLVDKNGQVVLEWHLSQIKHLEGVTDVKLFWSKNEAALTPNQNKMPHVITKAVPDKIAEITPPRYQPQTGNKTVALVCNLKGETGQIEGRLEVVLSFGYLMKDILPLGWWQSDMACLVEESGRYLAHTAEMMGQRIRLGETDDPLEKAVLVAMKESPFGTIVGSSYPTDHVAGFYKLKQAPWSIVLYASGKKILAPIRKFGFYYIIAGIFSIAVTLVLIRFVVGKMAHSIRDISEAAKDVANGHYGEPFPITSHDEIGQLTRSFNTMVEDLKEKEFIRDTFGRYMDEEVAKELMKRPGATKLGGESREVTILISDLRDFTPISESLSPEGTISILNRYFSRMIDVTGKYQGIIVDFFGDGILIFFDPIDTPIEPTVRKAIYCALEMQKSMKYFNAEMDVEGLPNLQMGVGINVGEVVVGNIGSETRAKYGIVGSPVNITQRIQSTARGGDVVISESAFNYLNKELIIGKSFTARLKGLTDSANLYLVKGLQPHSHSTST